MPKKNYFDFSLFDEVGDAMDLFANTIRNAFEYDSIGGKYEFDAVVLTQPVPMSISQIEAFLSSRPRPKSDEIADTGAETVLFNLLESSDEIPKFTFKARVIGPDSPHLFLPDPCDMEIVRTLSQQQRVQDIIDMHTTVIATGATEKPKKGNIVRIRFDPGTFKLNTQTAQFVSLRSNERSSISNILASQAKECVNGALNAFESFIGQKINDFAGTSYREHFDPSVGPLLSPLGRFAADDGDFYNVRSYGIHAANDFAIPRETPLYATHSGKVSWKKSDCESNEPNLDGDLNPVKCKDCGQQPAGCSPNKGGMGGNSLIIKHADGWYTFYGHLSPPSSGWIADGSYVQAGDLVAYSGNTGNSSGDHLHLELKKSGKSLNPILHFDYYYEDSKQKLQQEIDGYVEETTTDPTEGMHAPDESPVEDPYATSPI